MEEEVEERPGGGMHCVRGRIHSTGNSLRRLMLVICCRRRRRWRPPAIWPRPKPLLKELEELLKVLKELQARAQAKAPAAGLRGGAGPGPPARRRREPDRAAAPASADPEGADPRPSAPCPWTRAWRRSVPAPRPPGALLMHLEAELIP